MHPPLGDIKVLSQLYLGISTPLKKQIGASEQKFVPPKKPIGASKPIMPWWGELPRGASAQGGGHWVGSAAHKGSLWRGQLH
jgi:hypothetical protein